jgi:Tfp pilus assembly protein PilF
MSLHDLLAFRTCAAILLAAWLASTPHAHRDRRPHDSRVPVSFHGNRETGTVDGPVPGDVQQQAISAREVGRAAASVREYKKTFRTYPFSDPNPLPVFERIYPYFRFDRYTSDPVDRAWTVVELENRYLRVQLLPEIGGKIWTAIDKTSGRAFIYDNHVVKFRDIAMRGPWTSGGIEANYGIIGHTPNVATPVDYVTRRLPDGTATVTVGALDLLTRTAWRLEIALPPETAYFTTRSHWQNTSGVEAPYYSWMNVGLPAAGGLEFVFPGTHYIGHGGEVATWPVHPGNGKNLAFYDQNDFGSYKSYHVLGEYSDFWGAYWHDLDFGMARYGTRDDKLGKKIWIWGLSPQGMIWERLLTDTDGQYVEVQSGRLFNQAAEQSTRTPFKHRGFLPYVTDTWTEYWFPVKGTKGFVKASDLGALNVRTHERGIDLAFSPLQRATTTVEVFDGDTRVRALPVSFAPLQPWHMSLPVPIQANRLRVRIGDRFEYSADRAERTLSRPMEAPPDFDWASASGLALEGRELIRQRAYSEAELALDAALRKDPNYVPALTDKALLRYRAGDDEAAWQAARRALAIDTYDPAANYYYGLVSRALGRLTDARDGFDVAAQSIEYRAAALVQLAHLAIRAGQLRAAEEYATLSLQADRASLEARQVLALAYRLSDRAPRARAIVNEMLARDPLNHAARFEAYRLDPGPARRRAFVERIRHELPHETFLELAIWYHGLARDDDARELLALAPPVAEVAYWREYLDRSRQGFDITRALARAAEVSPRFVFPFRRESIAVFAWAVEGGGGWKPAYYLALLVRGLGDTGRARRLAEGCGSEPDFAPFYVFRAQLAAATDSALADLRRAAELEPDEWRIGRLLVERALADDRLPEAEQLAARYHARDPANYIIGMLHARTLMRAHRYQDALDLLSGLEVLPYEGATEGRSLYREANLMLALQALSDAQYDAAERFVAAARHWPEHLGAGKPYPEDTDERLEDWLQAAVLDARGAPDGARTALSRIIQFKGQGSGVGTLITALALTRLERGSEATARLDALHQPQRPAFTAWARRVLAGERVAPPPEVQSTDESRVFAAYLVRGFRL